MLTKEQIGDLEAAHGEVLHIRSARGLWECVYRRPTQPEYRLFKANAANPAKATTAQENLARACVVYPSLAEFEDLCRKYPAIADGTKVSEGLLSLLEADAEVVGKD